MLTQEEQLKDLAGQNRLLKEQNNTLAEAFMRVIKKSNIYQDALVSVNERTGGVLQRISGEALKAGRRLNVDLGEEK